jgi:chromosomal replication initiator protein
VTAPIEHTWQQISAHLRREVSSGVFDLWLAELEPCDLTDGRLLLAGADHKARWVTDRFGPALRRGTAAVLGPGATVEVVSRSQLAPDRSGPRASATTVGSPAVNPDYTFERFVIGEGNRLAHAAALAVAERPGQAYNPLFICGPPGVGKTHLLHSIASYARDHGGASVCCVTADWFTTSFVRALQTGSIDRFKAEHRSVDLLLVDDVQFLQDKTRTEEEFFHTFNALYESGSQLVFTSDRPPLDIAALERRLQERFASGLVADVTAPDFDTRLTILRKWARQEGYSALPRAILERLAERVTGNVRSLQGALARVVAVASLTGERLDEHLLDRVLATGRGRPPAPSVRVIQDATCHCFDITHAELVSSARSARVAWPRQLAMYLAREHSNATLPAIGRQFGGRDHSTVLYAWRKARGRIANDPAAGDTAARLLDHIQSTPAADREG